MKTTNQKPLTASTRLRDAGVYFCLAAATIIAYQQVRLSEFVCYDDNVYVTQNRHIQEGLTGESIKWAFTASRASNWHPLTWISHILDYRLFGTNPAGHHLVNLLFHVANSMMLLWILRRMTEAFWPSTFVAFAFALHPLHVESVAWVAERKDVLSGFFWMLTMAAYVRYTRKNNARSYLMVVVLFLLGLMAKPMLVTLPFILLLMDYWPLRRFQPGSIAAGKPGHLTGPNHKTTPAWRLVVEKLPLFLLAAASGIITFIVQQKGGAVSSAVSHPAKQRFANAAISYITYIGKMAWPTKLAVLYPHPGDGLSMAAAGLSLVLLAVVTVLLIYLSRRSGCGGLIVGWLWYLVTLVPVIGLVQVGVQGMADRYTYIPSIGIFMIVACLGAQLSRRSPFTARLLPIVCCMLLTVWLLAARRQVTYWRDSISLCRRALAVTTHNPHMHLNLGGALLAEGEPHEAVSHFRQALETKPDYAEAWNNLAWIFATAEEPGLRDAPKAIELAQKACALTDYSDASNLDTLAVAFAAASRFTEAAQYAEKALGLAISNDDANLIDEISPKLARYKCGKP